MQSGPDAFLGLSCLRSFRIPGSSISMSGIGGYGFPLGCGMSDVSSLVNTDFLENSFKKLSIKRK